MINIELWQESLDLAKDQLRHGKIHFSDLEKATKTIYDKLLLLQGGQVFDVVATDQQTMIEQTQKHEKTKKYVKCAICGEEFKVLGERHLLTHGLTRKEYMAKFGVSKSDMSINIVRNSRKGTDNPLKQMQMIMHEFDIKRGDVVKFIQSKGFSGLKELSDTAKGKNIDVVKALREVQG